MKSIFESETYQAHFECCNCGHHQKENIKKGEEARSELIKCDNCGCYKMKREWNPSWTRFDWEKPYWLKSEPKKIFGVSIDDLICKKL